MEKEMPESKVEYMAPDNWKQWHTELLQSTTNRVYNRVPFYRKAMDGIGVSPDDIQSVDDLIKLPFTTRQDLSDNYPYDLFAVPLRDIVRTHALRTAQTTPVVLGYTTQDLRHRQNLTARFLKTCGITPDDIVQICLDPGMAVWGQELREGAEELGALVIPPDPLSTSARLRVLADFRTSVLITTPSYGRHLLDTLQKSDISLASLSLRRGIFVGETLEPEIQKDLEEGFCLEVRAGYGIMEAVGPGMAYECREHDGLHLAMDHFIPEIIDPETGRVLPEGETGELVITTVTTRANPLIRLRTGDLTSLSKEPCACGRTTWRMRQVRERCDNLIFVRGIKIDPAQVEAFLGRLFHRAAPLHAVVLRPDRFLEQIELLIALDQNLFSGSLPDIHTWIRRVEIAFEEAMGLSCRVRPVEKSTLESCFSA